MAKPRSVDEWKLDKKAKRVVKQELKKWLKLFIEHASNEQGNVYRADFINNDFFYFTDCKDIFKDNPEAKGVEDNIRIRNRKRMVMNQLLIKTLLSDFVPKHIKCSHCGFENVHIDSMKDMGGHFKFCPKCGKTDLSTYPDFYHTCIQNVEERLIEKGFAKVKK